MRPGNFFMGKFATNKNENITLILPFGAKGLNQIRPIKISAQTPAFTFN
jgi:hypothetical protein